MALHCYIIQSWDLGVEELRPERLNDRLEGLQLVEEKGLEPTTLSDTSFSMHRELPCLRNTAHLR